MLSRREKITGIYVKKKKEKRKRLRKYISILGLEGGKAERRRKGRKERGKEGTKRGSEE